MYPINCGCYTTKPFWHVGVIESESRKVVQPTESSEAYASNRMKLSISRLMSEPMLISE